MSARARLRRVHKFLIEYPILRILPGLIIGQLCTFITPLTALLILGYGVIKSCCFQWGITREITWRGSYSGLLLGALSVLMLLPAVPSARELRHFDSSRSFVAKIDGSPRRRQIGEIQVPLKIFGRVELVQGTEPIIKGHNKELRFLCKARELPWLNISKVRNGDLIIIRANFQELKYADLLSYDGFLRRQGFIGTCKIKYATEPILRDESYIQILRREIKVLVERILGQGEVSGLPLSTSLGIKDVLSSRTEEDFRRTGLSHVLVVSGYQVTLVYGSVLAIFLTGFSRIAPLVRRYSAYSLAVGPALAVTGGFVLLVEPDGPVLRAWLALLIVAVAKFFEVGRNGAHTLLVGLAFMALVSPGCYLDPGVELSFAALAGLQIGDRIGRGIVGKFMWSSLAASTLTGLVSAVRFGGMSVSSLFINPWFAPFLSVVGCKLVIVGISLAALGLDPQGLILAGTSEALLVSRDLVRHLASVTIGYYEGSLGVVISVALTTLVLLMLKRQRAKI